MGLTPLPASGLTTSPLATPSGAETTLPQTGTDAMRLLLLALSATMIGALALLASKGPTPRRRRAAGPRP